MICVSLLDQCLLNTSFPARLCPNNSHTGISGYYEIAEYLVGMLSQQSFEHPNFVDRPLITQS